MSEKVLNLYELRPRQARPFEELEDGTVDVLIPRYGEKVLGGLIKNILPNRPVRVHLDDVGTCVWRLCDGDCTVKQIGESLHEQFGDRVEPLYDKLETFIRQMHRAGLIEV